MIGEIKRRTAAGPEATVKALRAALALDGELRGEVLTDYFDRSGPPNTSSWQSGTLRAGAHAGGSSSFSWLCPGLTVPLSNRPSPRGADQDHCETVLRAVPGMAGGQLLVLFCASGRL